MHGEKVQAFFFLPMRKATAMTNKNFTVTGLHRAVDGCGRVIFLHGGMLLLTD
jgi:hypothetical protein